MKYAHVVDFSMAMMIFQIRMNKLRYGDRNG